MAVAVSLGRLYALSICSIFSQCIESKALEKSTNNSVASIFFHVLLRGFNELSGSEKLWIDFFENRFDFSQRKYTSSQFSFELKILLVFFVSLYYFPSCLSYLLFLRKTHILFHLVDKNTYVSNQPLHMSRMRHMVNSLSEVLQV